MPVIIASKTKYTGTATPSALNTETTVVEITAQSDDYIVEGWIDLRNLSSGDAVTLREYIAIDGVNYRTFITAQYSGAVSDPVIRFHAKTLPSTAKYKVTITQTAGTLRSFPYSFILEVMGTA
jgi:hypothetical protein